MDRTNNVLETIVAARLGLIAIASRNYFDRES